MTLMKIVNGAVVEMSTEEETEILAERQASADAVPSSVSMPRARLALLAVGKLDAVDVAINALSSPDKEKARIWWDYSGFVERHHEYVVMLASAIGLDDAGVDALFVAASQY